MKYFLMMNVLYVFTYFLLILTNVSLNTLISLVLGLEPRASCILGKSHACWQVLYTEQHLQTSRNVITNNTEAVRTGYLAARNLVIQSMFFKIREHILQREENRHKIMTSKQWLAGIYKGVLVLQANKYIIVTTN